VNIPEYSRLNFFPIKTVINNKEIKEIINNFFVNKKINNSFFIKDISSLDKIVDESILFIEKTSRPLSILNKKIQIITDDINIYNSDKFKDVYLVSDVNRCYTILLNEIFIHEDSLFYEDSFVQINNSYISKFAKIHPTVKIYNNCVIGRGVEIGKNCIIKNNVTIKNTILSENIIISDNTSIGCTGFGFDIKNIGAKDIYPHIGIVIIDNNVHIGSNCCIDRGKIDFTYIGPNTMIDNLVHIAHNVVIEENACIAAQSGISGSVKIGKNLVCGGQSGFAGHITIGSNVIVAGKSGVTKNIKDNSTVAGFPATDIKEWKKRLIKERKNGHK